MTIQSYGSEPPSVETALNKYLLDIAFHFVLYYSQNHDGLIERWKRKNMENLLELHNKTPVWNDGMFQ